MNSSLTERLKAAARVARTVGGELAQFDERTPGVRTRILTACAHRGEVKDRRQAPCCGGKVRQEELFACSHPRNGWREAWSIVCQGCILGRTDENEDTLCEGMIDNT